MTFNNIIITIYTNNIFLNWHWNVETYTQNIFSVVIQIIDYLQGIVPCKLCNVLCALYCSVLFIVRDYIKVLHYNITSNVCNSSANKASYYTINQIIYTVYFNTCGQMRGVSLYLLISLCNTIYLGSACFTPIQDNLLLIFKLNHKKFKL